MVKRLRGILQPFLPAPDSQAVLDIGCGMGFALLTLKDMGFTELRGIDVDADQARCAQKFGLQVEHVQDTFAFLDRHAGQFDIVLMFDVLEHIPVDEQICMMRFVNRALKPGGRVILQVPNATSMMATWQRHIDFTHWTTFTPVSLSFVLRNAGFERIHIPGQGPLRLPRWRLGNQGDGGGLRRWIVEFFWRQVLQVYVGAWVDVAHLPVDLDMRALAFKPALPRETA
jgi:SAM-dependent methyltransferase